MSNKRPISNRKVKFIGIGGQRCGKNTIYSWLTEHPEVCTTPKMELHYFSYKYSRGYEWYENNFEPNVHTQMIGEMSSSYLYDNEVPERVYKYQPDMKIILSVRDPVKRLISAFKHDILTECVTKENYNFEKAISNNPTYIEYGQYYKYLRKWLEIFPKKNILIIDFHKMIKDPLFFSKKIYDFIKVDSSFTPKSIDSKFNKSYIPKYQFPLKLITLSKFILETLGFKKLVSVMRRIGIRNYIDKLNDSKVTVEISENERKKLEEMFCESNQNLSEFLDSNNLFK